MNSYEYTIQVKVRVDAFTESDAESIIEDTFGEGGQAGLDVLEYEVLEVEHGP